MFVHMNSEDCSIGVKCNSDLVREYSQDSLSEISESNYTDLIIYGCLKKVLPWFPASLIMKLGNLIGDPFNSPDEFTVDELNDIKYAVTNEVEKFYQTLSDSSHIFLRKELSQESEIERQYKVSCTVQEALLNGISSIKQDINNQQDIIKPIHENMSGHVSSLQNSLSFSYSKVFEDLKSSDKLIKEFENQVLQETEQAKLKRDESKMKLEGYEKTDNFEVLLEEYLNLQKKLHGLKKIRKF